VRRSEIRNEEELNQILTNGELDETGKAEAIKAMVGKGFVPTAKYNAEKANTKTQLDAYNALKTEYETFKQSKMTDEEKQAEQARQIQEQYQKANLTISKMCAENTFAKAGFKEEDYKGILENIVTEDTEKTKGLAEMICSTMLKQKQDIEKTITDSIVNGTKTPQGGESDTPTSDVDKYKKLYDDAVKNNDFTKMSYYTRVIQELETKNK